MRFLITGGTGSFGRYAVGKLADLAYVKEVIVFSRDEEKQLDMKRTFKSDKIKYVIGNIKNFDALSHAMKEIDVVIHTAALKTIPACEENPYESVKTNVLGTWNVINAVKENGVAKAVLLSTDKAVKPINVYGACKMLAEQLWISSQTEYSRFTVVRYGNVVGSRGSVIPYFRELISQKKPLTITHKNMTRFFLTQQKAYEFVFYVLGIMDGGEIFIPKLKACKITDIAKSMAGDTYPLCFTGVRRGEKITETLISEKESIRTKDCGGHYIIYDSEKRYSCESCHRKRFTSQNAERYGDCELYRMIKES